MRKVTDPALLEQLEGKKVTDPAVIAQLESKETNITPAVNKASQFASGVIEGALTLPSAFADLTTAAYHKGVETNLPIALFDQALNKLVGKENRQSIRSIVPTVEEGKAALRGVGITQQPDGSVVTRTAGEYLGGGIAGGLKRLKDLAMVGASGLAAGKAREVFPDKPLVELGAALLPFGLAHGLRTAKSAVEPLYRSGREQIVGGMLRRTAEVPEQQLQAGTPSVGGAINKMAANADDAMARLNNIENFVPGSVPTTAQITRDPGLLSLERALRSTPQGSKFAIRDAQQNAARQTLLKSIAKDEAAINTAIAQREAEAIPLIEQARNSGAKVDINPIVDKIDDFLKGESGKQRLVRTALVDVKRNLFDEIDGQLIPETDVGRLYGVRKDISDALSGRLGGEKSSARFARKQLLEVMDVLDNQINAVAPTFKPYLKKYSEMSSPINQLETLQDISTKTKIAGVDVLGENITSQAKWFNTVTKNEKELSQVLTKDQMETLKKIGKDLDRGALSVSGGKAAGSNTFQNLSTAHAIGTLLGNRFADVPVLQSALRPMRWVYKIPEEKMQEMLIDAMLEPTTAKLLMQKASKDNIQRVAARLRQTVVASSQSQPRE